MVRMNYLNVLLLGPVVENLSDVRRFSDRDPEASKVETMWVGSSL